MLCERVGMTKYFAALMLCLAHPAQAWEFTPTPVCTLTDASSPTDLKSTYDGELYTLVLSNAEGWPNNPIFSIRFAPLGPYISTSKHQIEGSTLTVSDTGFGNVLNGLQINQTAQITLGDMVRDIDLKSARAPVGAFKRCEPGVPMS
jgi:hypothetical protein